MKVRVSPIKIINRDGYKLFGIFHEPDISRPSIAILILSPGIKSRVAPHRLYIKMAERFTNLGFCVLRIDPTGLGDSEGEIDEFYTADVYGSMELGRLVNDTIDAMNWLQETHSINRFILSGLCGGAITGLLVGAMDQRVDSLLSLGMTCIVTGSTVDSTRYITKGQLTSMRQKYFSKLLKPSAWLRLITLQSDFRLMFKSLIKPFLSHSSQQKTNAPESNFLPPSNTNLNPHFPPAFFSFVRNRKILMIFSEVDRLYWEFQEKFVDHYGNRVKSYQHNMSIHIVKNANHVFSFSEWQREMLELSTQWLKRLYGELPSV